MYSRFSAGERAVRPPLNPPRFPRLVEAAVRDAEIVINLVGILSERGEQGFDAVQGEGARTVARAAARIGAQLIHISAIGADANSPARYARSNARGEALVLAEMPGVTIFRPSILFGPEDKFFNRFAGMARILPFLPLIGDGSTRFQPVFVGDGIAAGTVSWPVRRPSTLPEGPDNGGDAARAGLAMASAAAADGHLGIRRCWWD
jgi:uncharacterized protein YbjT (DUF2867 family)